MKNTATVARSQEQSEAIVLENAPTFTEGDKIVGVIYETREYDKFTLMEGNRVIYENNRKKLGKSMSKFGQLTNAIVNKEAEVADGQHRFVEAKRLNLPFRYEVREDFDIQKVQEMQNGKAWNYRDVVHSFSNPKISTHNRSYLLYENFKKMYNLGHNMTLSLITNAFLTKSTIPHDEFKSGNLKVTEDQLTIAHQYAKKILEFAPYHKRFNKRVFVLAILSLEKNVQGYTHEKMISQLQKNSRELFEHAKTKYYVQNLIDIYNKGTHKDNRIRFDENMLIPGE